MGITGGTGVFFMLLSVGLIMARLVGSKSLRKGKLTKNAAEGTILSSAAYAIFVLCPNEVGYYLSPLLLGLGNGRVWPAFMNMMIQMGTNNQRGTANSTLLVSWDLGIGIGVLAGGLMAEFVGYRMAFMMVAVAQLLGTLLFFCATRQFFFSRRIG